MTALDMHPTRMFTIDWVEVELPNLGPFDTSVQGTLKGNYLFAGSDEPEIVSTKEGGSWSGCR